MGGVWSCGRWMDGGGEIEGGVMVRVLLRRNGAREKEEESIIPSMKIAAIEQTIEKSQQSLCPAVD